VPGELDESWSDWIESLTIAVESEGEGPPVTSLTGTLDQAALHSLLRHPRAGTALDFGHQRGVLARESADECGESVARDDTHGGAEK
jgi:hypothetical protein